MHKIALIGNVRFNYGYPTNHNKWIDIQNDYFTNALYPTLVSELKQDDYIILMGNTFELSHAIPMETIEHYTKLLVNLSAIAQVLIINGQNDITNSNGTKQSLNYLSNQIKNVKTIDSIEHIDNITLLPLSFNKLDLSNNLPLSTSNVLISNKKSSIIQHDIFKNYQIKLTSIHHPTDDIIRTIGNCIQMNEVELNDIVGIQILDTQTLKLKPFLNLRSPIFTTIKLNSEDDITKLEKNKSKNHINLIIDANLIRSNRSFKRRIDIMLSKHIYNRVSYINIQEVTKDVEILDTVDPNLSYDTIIRNYIDRYPSDNETKNLLASEYEKVFRILNKKNE
jgi:hypothetical protein